MSECGSGDRRYDMAALLVWVEIGLELVVFAIEVLGWVGSAVVGH